MSGNAQGSHRPDVVRRAAGDENLERMEPVMDGAQLRERLRQHLGVLVEQIGPRPPGSPGNRRATDYLRTRLSAAGLDVAEAEFVTQWWEPEPCLLETPGGSRRELIANPFSQAGEVRGPVVKVETREALLGRSGQPPGAVIVLGPAIGGDPVVPKSFPFFMPDEHRELIAALEVLRPAAVIAVSERHASLPTFEDPELCFPSLTVAPEVGAQLRPGEEVHIVFRGRNHRGHGVNISARTAAPGRRLVASAHVDAKITTPGAFDNAGSVAALLVLAETASSDLGPVEFVFFNGEDHYDAGGELAWLEATDLAEVAVNVNLDGVGVRGRRTGVTCLACPPPIQDRIARLGDEDSWTLMPPWFESDHAIFAMRDIPAVAVTSEHVHDLLTSVAHTPADTLDVVDVDILLDIVHRLRGLFSHLDDDLR